MKKVLGVLAVLLLFASACFADTIYLKSGSVVKGDILEKTEDQIKINANGMTLTYYADEVDRIEGAAQASGPVATPPPLTSTPLPSETVPPETSSSADLMLLSKKELTLRYMEATGAKGNMRKTFNEIINAASEDKKDQLRKALNLDDVLEQLIPIYDQYFTEQDLRALITFYESPLGQKILKTAPLILKDSMEKSIQYFQGKI